MVTKYVQAAMKRATYELLEEGEGFFGHIPELQGVWANAQTLEACREELQSVLEGWILVSVSMHMNIPVIDEIDLNVKDQVQEEELV